MEEPVTYPRTVRWTMLAAASLVMAAAVIAIPALPQIGRELDATQTELQWAVDITPVVLAALVLLCGSLLDRFGRRRGLIVGLTLLAASLTWSGLAGSPGELLAARFFTGVGAAIVFPGTLATLTAITPEADRSRVIGYWAAATMGGGTWALIVSGGFLESSLWWGSFFVASGLIAVACLVATVLTVPETRDPEHATLDPVGALLSLIAVGALVAAIIEVPVHGVGDPVIVAAFAGGLIALVAFIRWELRTPAPMLDVRLFRHRKFAGGSAAVFLLFVGCYGWFFLSFQYFAYVMGYNPLEGGLGLIPNAVATVPCAILGSRMAQRYGWRPVVVVSLLFTGAGALVMALVAAERSIVLIAISFFVFGIGLGLGQSAPTQAIVDALPRAKQGVASAVNDAARELGAAVGIAIMGSAFNIAYRASIYDAGFRERLTDIVRDSPAVGLNVAQQRPRIGAELQEAIAVASIEGWQLAFIVATVLFVVSAAAIWVFAREPRGAPDGRIAPPAMLPPPPPVGLVPLPDGARQPLPTRVAVGVALALAVGAALTRRT